MRKFEFTKTARPQVGKKSGTTYRLWRAFSILCLLLLANWPNFVTAQCGLACNDQVNISLPGPTSNCALTVTVEMVLEEPYNCPNPLAVTIFTPQGLPIVNNPTVGASLIGQTLIYSVTETISGNSCWGTVQIEDKLGPTATGSGCVDRSIACLGDYRPTTDGGDVPAVTFADCSNITSIAYTDIVSNGNCTTPFASIVLRSWTATDQFGNTTNCSQYVTVNKVSLADYTPVCPANVNMQCGNGTPNTSPTATGYPTITVSGIAYPVIPGDDNFCQLAASYSDEVFDICGGGKKILRTWNIYDWCLPTNPSMGNPFNCIQVIKIEDTVAPTIACPAPIVFPAASSACSASLNLPGATVSDACSNWTVKILTPFGVVTGNGGMILNVPVGAHNLTYVATDACGNQNTCLTTLTINDNTPPVAVCDENTTIALTADGTALVSATVFDDGSTDNCAVDHFEVRRMANACQPATPFGPFVTFECCDVAHPLQVAFRVFDTNGNHNECMVNVMVQDKIDPTIVCPPNKTIQCADPVTAAVAPTFDDNCPGAVWSVTEVENITNCGVGTITRNYKVTDASGRMATCTQTITVVNSNPFSLANITWPLDYTTNVCDPDLEPEDLPLGYDYPNTFGDQCDMIAVTHTDQLLPTNFPACFKILRKWIVINWCQYNPNISNSPGYWEHTQIVKVVDETAPVLTCPGNISVSSSDPNCAIGQVTVPAIGVTDCSTSFIYSTTIDYFTNGSNDIVNNNPDLSGGYPFGTHKATVKVEDKCGNFSTCQLTISVVDGKKPTPICVNGLAVELMADPTGNGGMIQLTPQMFNQGSFDNCTANGDLQLQLTPNFFTCDDVGTNIVTMWVTDQAGNADYCETYVIIQDNMVICPDALTADISGGIATTASLGIQNVMVSVSGNGPLTAPVLTSSNGHFQFFDLDLGHDYTFTPSHNQQPLNGVTTYDIVLITKHILSVQLLDTPYKLIAADVNKSGTVTTVDVLELRKLILQVIPNFTNNTAWRFVDKDYSFPNAQNPFLPAFPEYFNINNLASDQMDVDFVAVKIGDVNGSATSNAQADNTADRSGDALAFVVEDRLVKAGETVKVPFRANNFNDLLGFQFALQFDTKALDFVEMQPGGLNNMTAANFGYTMLEEGMLTASWDNSKNTQHNNTTTLFSLVFKAKTNTSLSEILQLADRTMPAEAYQEADNQPIGLVGVRMDFSNPTKAPAIDGTDFELLQNQPNPFNEWTAIGFRLPEAGVATLRVYDLSGKILTVVSRNFEKGFNEIRLDKKDLGSSGVLFYKLETASQTATRKMVIGY